MKKWHLEEVLHVAPHPKILLPEPGQMASFLYSTPAGIRKEHKLVIFCRHLAAFFIRFF